MQVTKKMIEAGARAIHAYRSSALWQEMTGQWQEHCQGEAKAGIEAALSAMWQPIETAPRDGRAIILFDPKRGQRMGWTFENDPWQITPPSAWNATHWMPLPPTPETT